MLIYYLLRIGVALGRKLLDREVIMLGNYVGEFDEDGKIVWNKVDAARRILLQGTYCHIERTVKEK